MTSELLTGVRINLCPTITANGREEQRTMQEFVTKWNEAALTTLGLFRMAFWAFSFGYIISGCIQVFVTREQMQRTMATSVDECAITDTATVTAVQ